ncbi:MAG: EcsC family protein [Lachnospiraceae bacterium]|nr:EcsC family protein [Lachnospiraceae bacterium]
MKANKIQKYRKSVEKELAIVRRQEETLKKHKTAENSVQWREVLTSKVPDKVYDNLLTVFAKAFSLIFDKGVAVIEKTYNQEELADNYKIKEYAFRTKADRKSLRKIKDGAEKNHIRNMAVTTAEGIGLGAFGIGLPDIVIFVGVLLRGIYETALHYGYRYDSREEQYFILKMVEVSMLKGDAWVTGNAEIDEMMAQEPKTERTPSDIKAQIKRTSTAFAVDMILLKFVQGIPVVGMIGGAGNPVYYNRVMKYAELKYRKRRLMQLLNEIGEMQTVRKQK